MKLSQIPPISRWFARNWTTHGAVAWLSWFQTITLTENWSANYVRNWMWQCGRRHWRNLPEKTETISTVWHKSIIPPLCASAKSRRCIRTYIIGLMSTIKNRQMAIKAFSSQVKCKMPVNIWFARRNRNGFLPRPRCIITVQWVFSQEYCDVC